MEKHYTVYRKTGTVAHKRRKLNFETLLEQDKNKPEKEARSPESRQNAR